jgi:hypothetical protein
MTLFRRSLGIGFSATIFSVFYNGFLYPFPYRDASRLTVIGITDSATVPNDFARSTILLALAGCLAGCFLGYFGLLVIRPGLLAVKKDLRTNLQSSGLGVNAPPGGARIRAGLVVSQVALSMLLLVYAGLMIRSFLAVTNFNPGIRTQGIIRAGVHFAGH